MLYPVVVLAILASGCTYTGSSPVYTQKELKHHLTASEAKYVISTPDLMKHVEPVVDEIGTGIEPIVFSDLFKETTPPIEPPRKTLHDLKKAASPSDLFARLKKISPDSIATLLATSGSTGLPRLVARTHAAHLAEVKAITTRTSTQSYAARKLYCLPIYHAFTFPEAIFNALYQGEPTYFLKRFGDAFSYRIRDHEITDIMATPNMLLELEESASGDLDIKADLQTLKTIYCGGAPLAKELRERFLKLFHDTPKLVNVYGMTECGWISTSDDDSRHDSCVGRTLEGFEARLDESTVSTSSDGQRLGELEVKGKQIMTGYKNDSTASNDPMVLDDWLKTRDIGSLKDGQIHLFDRAKDLIKLDGFPVSPIEFEHALREITQVEDVAVISSLSNSLDEQPVIFIVRRDEGGDLTNAKVKQHLMSRMSRYKVAKCRIRFVQSIPRGEDGKTLREEMRQQLSQ